MTSAIATHGIIPLLQFDDFAADAAAVREDVIAGGFSDQRGPDGALYQGISQYPVPHWFDVLSKNLGCKITPRLSCFRINYRGENPHSWVHSDDICAKYASVLYLNTPEQCSGGTAFWEHEKWGDHLLSDDELRTAKINRDLYHAMMTAEWKRKQPWKQTDFVAMRFNRFITYPTCFFHSRYPFEAFGTTPEDGRLIWICFYDKENL